MNLSELKRRVLAALDHPNTENRLVASIALGDFSDSKDEVIEKYEALLHKLATSPRTPQWIVDEAREVLASDDEGERGHPDAWTGGFAANH